MNAAAATATAPFRVHNLKSSWQMYSQNNSPLPLTEVVRRISAPSSRAHKTLDGIDVDAKIVCC